MFFRGRYPCLENIFGFVEAHALGIFVNQLATNRDICSFHCTASNGLMLFSSCTRKVLKNCIAFITEGTIVSKAI